MATIHYARLLAELGHYDACERTLENGVASDFVPAYFWLAWCRYEQSKTTKVRGEVRPLLEYAAEKGHPEAKILLARWMALGKLAYATSRVDVDSSLKGRRVSLFDASMPRLLTVRFGSKTDIRPVGCYEFAARKTGRLTPAAGTPLTGQPQDI